VVAGCRRTGYITTLAGRRRYFADINSPNFTARGKAERAAVNSVPQGSAADLVKCVMVDLVQQLGAAGLSDHVRMLLQVGRCTEEDMGREVLCWVWW
jgi:DNA polymerase-1